MKRVFTWIALTTRQAGWAPILVFLLHAVLSLAFHAYDKLPDLDLPMHFAGGVAIAYFLYHAVIQATQLGIIDAYKAFTRFALVWGYVCAAAVLWEFAEYLCDAVLGTMMQAGLRDTMGDMLCGIIGGTVFIVARAMADRRTDRSGGTAEDRGKGI
jgi:hypothetical protein